MLETEEAPKVRMGDIAKAAGISRQALYLHFPTRAELLTETARHVDQAKGIDERLAESRTAPSGVDRLDAFISAWGNYIPEIAGLARALMAMQDTDEAARTAWADRMDAVRQGCAAAVEAIQTDGQLAPPLSPEKATDLLWTLLSVRNWQQLTGECGWTQAEYLEGMRRLSRQALLNNV